MEKLKPINDQIVLRREPEEEASRGGIIIPDTAKVKPQICTVVAAGPGARNDAGERIPMSVHEGDRVVIGKYSGTELEHGDNKYIVLRENEILGVVS